MKTDNVVSIYSVGDVALATITIEKKFKLSSDVVQLFKDSDFNVFNLEFPLTFRGEKYFYDARDEFKVKLEEINVLKEVEWNLVTLATNHILDWGLEGILTTKETLKKFGWISIGAGRDLIEASEPYIIDIKGIKFAFFNACKKGRWSANDNKPGANIIDKNLIKSIKNLAYSKQVDHIIVFLHWGFEYSSYPSPEQIKFAHKLIDAGVSVILGSHPHTLQGFEKYKNGLIFYSQGNFIYDYKIDMQPSLEALEKSFYTGIFNVVFAKNEIVNFNFIPLVISENLEIKKPSKSEEKYISSFFFNISEGINNKEKFYLNVLNNIKNREKNAWLIKTYKYKSYAIFDLIKTIKLRHIKIILASLYYSIKKYF